MLQVEDSQSSKINISFEIIDNLVKQAPRADVASISSTYLIEANQELTLLEEKLSDDTLEQIEFNNIKQAFFDVNQVVLNQYESNCFSDYARFAKEYHYFHSLISQAIVNE